MKKEEKEKRKTSFHNIHLDFGLTRALKKIILKIEMGTYTCLQNELTQE